MRGYDAWLTTDTRTGGPCYPPEGGPFQPILDAVRGLERFAEREPDAPDYSRRVEVGVIAILRALGDCGYVEVADEGFYNTQAREAAGWLGMAVMALLTYEGERGEARKAAAVWVSDRLSQANEAIDKMHWHYHEEEAEEEDL